MIEDTLRMLNLLANSIVDVGNPLTTSPAYSDLFQKHPATSAARLKLQQAESLVRAAMRDIDSASKEIDARFDKRGKFLG